MLQLRFAPVAGGALPTGEDSWGSTGSAAGEEAEGGAPHRSSLHCTPPQGLQLCACSGTVVPPGGCGLPRDGRGQPGGAQQAVFLGAWRQQLETRLDSWPLGPG